MVGSLLLAVAVHGVDRPLQPTLYPHALADQNRTAGWHEGRSSLVDMSESYFSGELKCPEGCFAQPVRDDHAGIMRHHLNKAQDFEDTAEESTGENQTKAYEEMYKEMQVRPLPAQLTPTPTPSLTRTRTPTLTRSPTLTLILTLARSCTLSSRDGTTSFGL
jgi:hypothetical protein